MRQTIPGIISVKTISIISSLLCTDALEEMENRTKVVVMGYGHLCNTLFHYPQKGHNVVY